MKLRVICGQCSREFLLGQEYAGKTIRCPACKTAIFIAAPAPPAAASSAAPLQTAIGGTGQYSLLDDLPGPELPAAQPANSLPAPKRKKWKRGGLQVSFDWRSVLGTLAKAPAIPALFIALFCLIVYINRRSTLEAAVAWCEVSLWISGLMFVAGSLWFAGVVFRRGEGRDIAIILLAPLASVALKAVLRGNGEGPAALPMLTLAIDLAIFGYQMRWCLANWAWAGRPFGLTVVAFVMLSGAMICHFVNSRELREAQANAPSRTETAAKTTASELNPLAGADVPREPSFPARDPSLVSQLSADEENLEGFRLRTPRGFRRPVVNETADGVERCHSWAWSQMTGPDAMNELFVAQIHELRDGTRFVPGSLAGMLRAWKQGNGLESLTIVEREPEEFVLNELLVARLHFQAVYQGKQLDGFGYLTCGHATALLVLGCSASGERSENYRLMEAAARSMRNPEQPNLRIQPYPKSSAADWPNFDPPALHHSGRTPSLGLSQRSEGLSELAKRT